MKRLIFLLALGGIALGTAPTALAQTDSTRTTQKPQLNTAPPGPATAPRPTQPAERPAVPVPAPPPVDQPLPASRPNVNSPSGLEFPAGSKASEQPKPLRKYFLYSNFGLGYSSNPYSGGQFSASISPAIGYRVTDKLALGPGISYAYNNVSFPEDYQGVGLPSSLNLNSIGLKGFLQYIIYKEFFLHAEYEVTKAQSYYIEQTGPQTLRAVTVNRVMRTPLAGAGYRSQLGDRIAADIVVLYNFNDGYDVTGYPLSPYGQPVIRFSFLFDLK